MALLEEVRSIRTAAAVRQEQTQQALKMQERKEWLEREEREARRVIAELPAKLRAAAEDTELLHCEVLLLEHENCPPDDEEMSRGTRLEELRGAAVSVCDWCVAQGFTVRVGFESGLCNDGRYYLYVVL